MGYASRMGSGAGARTVADLVRERNNRAARADRWRAEHPGPISDEMTFRVGQWVEKGGHTAPWEPIPPAVATYPPIR